MAMKKKRNRRTPEQIIADLQAEIERVRSRAAAREAKTSPEGKAFLAATKALDRASDLAREARNKEMVKALEAGRAPLSAHLARMGVKTVGKRVGRKRRAKGGAA